MRTPARLTSSVPSDMRSGVAYRPVGCRLRAIYEGKAPTLVGAGNCRHEN